LEYPADAVSASVSGPAGASGWVGCARAAPRRAQARTASPARRRRCAAAAHAGAGALFWTRLVPLPVLTGHDAGAGAASAGGGAGWDLCLDLRRPPPFPLPPVLNGHVSSLSPY